MKNVPAIKKLILSLFLIYFWSVIILFLAHVEKLYSCLGFQTFVLSATVFLSIVVIRTLPRNGFNFFDPGLILVIYIALNILPIAIIGSYSFEIIYLDTSRYENQLLFGKTLLGHSVFLCSFTFIYLFFSTCYKSYYDSRYNDLIFKDIFVWLFLLGLFYSLSFIINNSKGPIIINPWTKGGSLYFTSVIRKLGMISAQFNSKIELCISIIISFAVGVFTVKASNIHMARIKLAICLIFIFLLKFSLTTERGFILIIGIGAAAYADSIRWKGNLLNWRLVLICVFGGFLLNISSKLFEAFALGYSRIFENLNPVRIFTLRTAPPWITTVTMTWIDNLEMNLLYGKSYYDAIVRGIFPSQVLGHSPSLAQWFAHKLLPTRAARGVGFGFSLISEGYLNAKMIGIFLHGVIIGCFSALIRYFQYGKASKKKGIFIYIVLLGGFYKIYHLGFDAIVSKFIWLILCAIFIVFLANIVVESVRNQR